ncbi:MAG: 5'/3'-nucleotidase SurE [Acidobacteriota bacterium]
MTSILVTNDDGVHSAGLLRLAEVLEALGEVTVVAPDREKSASSHALTLHRPVRIRGFEARRFMVDGTPSDCVYLGALQVLERKPDLVVSGINHGSNIGDDVTYSGTIAAAFEGTILGIPSFAISLAGADMSDFTAAAMVAELIAGKILADRLPRDTLLNVNVPADEIKGLRCTRQGRRIYDETVHRGVDPRGNEYYWIGSGEVPHMDQGPDTDYMAVREGFVSVTPLHLDLTHYESLELMSRDWGADLESSLLRLTSRSI